MPAKFWTLSGHIRKLIVIISQLREWFEASAE
jgi:hypothetical protein